MKKSITLIIISVLLIFSICYAKVTNPFDNIIYETTSPVEAQTNSLNGGINIFLTYNNKHIYFSKGEKIKNKHQLYILRVLDTQNNTEQVIATTLLDNVTLYNNTIYYFSSSIDKLGNATNTFCSYNLDTNKKEKIELTQNIKILYSMVSYNDAIYFGVLLEGESGHGILKYDINKKSSSIFSNLDIRLLDENFAFIGNGFVSVCDGSIYFFDFEGNEKIIYTDRLLDNKVNIENNQFVVSISDVAFNTFPETIAKLKFDITTFEMEREDLITISPSNNTSKNIMPLLSNSIICIAIILFIFWLLKTKKLDKSLKKKILIIFIVFLIILTFIVQIIKTFTHVLCTSIDKPIIYLYPDEEITVNVKLGNPQDLTSSYPKYTAEGWNVLAKPNGDLINLNNNRNLYALYWEGKNSIIHNTSEGFVIKGEETIEFLEEKLAILGLNERETEEFIIYWLPQMENNIYNFIRFQTIEEINYNMPLKITPTPDSIIRIVMEWKPLDKYIDIPEQVLSSPTRTGFTVVEWGGTKIN